MNFSNFTPFPSISWDNVDCNNDWHVTTLSRIRYKILKNDTTNKYDLVLHTDQGELTAKDTYYDKAGKSSIRYESDYVPYKKYTDIVINANGYANGKESVNFKCSVKVFDNNNLKIIDYPLRIKSEKKYEQIGLIWIGKERQKELSVPIIYEKSFGGDILKKKKNEEDEDKYIYTNVYNPVGCGVKKLKNVKKIINSVQIFYEYEKLKDVPAGYGFIDKSWESRLKYAGTYDDAWLKNQHPLPPFDFDEYFNQAAHPKLILKDYIKYGYKIELKNLKKDTPLFSIEIPYNNLVSCIQSNITKKYTKMNIDTVLIDINSEDENEHSVYLSYRTQNKKFFDIKESQVMILEDNIKGTV